jgi:hypothetical protein
MATKAQIDQIIPGGIRGDDFIHRKTTDGTCSRCREDIPEDDFSLMLWSQDGENLLIYCDKCCVKQKKKK